MGLYNEFCYDWWSGVLITNFVGARNIVYNVFFIAVSLINEFTINNNSKNMKYLTLPILTLKVFAE